MLKIHYDIPNTILVVKFKSFRIQIFLIQILFRNLVSLMNLLISAKQDSGRNKVLGNFF